MNAASLESKKASKRIKVRRFLSLSSRRFLDRPTDRLTDASILKRKRQQLSTADHRNSSSGKSDLKGELKKVEGKSVKDLGF